MKKVHVLFTVFALLFSVMSCSNGSSSGDPSGSENNNGGNSGSGSEFIVGTWEGRLYVVNHPNINYTLSFTFKKDGTYTHELTPNLTTVIIGPGTWSFNNDYVTITPYRDPDDPMRAKYDSTAKTLSWTVKDSGNTYITMKKKSSNNGKDPGIDDDDDDEDDDDKNDGKIGTLNVNYTVPQLPANVGNNFLAGRTISYSSNTFFCEITFNEDLTGTYEEDRIYWKIKYSYNEEKQSFSFYRTELKDDKDGNYHDFAYYKSKLENETIESVQKKSGYELDPKNKYGYSRMKSGFVTIINRMLPKEQVKTTDSDDKITRAYQKGILKNYYAVYFNSMQTYLLEKREGSPFLVLDYNNSLPFMTNLKFTGSNFAPDAKYEYLELVTRNQSSHRFYSLRIIKQNGGQYYYPVSEITEDYIEVTFIPSDLFDPSAEEGQGPFYTENVIRIPYKFSRKIVDASGFEQVLLTLTIEGTDYPLMGGCYHYSVYEY